MKTKISLLSFLVTASALMVTPLVNAATYYWDNNGTTANYGTAGGTWAAPTVGSATQGWTTATNGTTAPTGSITTLSTSATTDAVNFGNGASGLAAGTITVGTVAAGNMTFAAGSGAIVLSTGTITLSATQTTTVNNATNTINSILAGAGTSFTKAGTGILVLTGANSYTGSTIISAGTINLGGGTADGSLSSTTLTLGGGSLSYTRTGSNTQTFSTTSITGSSMISGVVGNTLNLGTVSRGTGNRFYDFGTTGLGIIAANTASNSNGIMGGFTVGDSWAVANGTGVAISGLAGGSYTLTSVATTNEATYLDANVDVDDNSGSPAAAITANSLRFSEAEANTLTLATGTNTITSGGILVGSGVGANLSTITGGTLTGLANKDLVIIQNNTSGGLTIASDIVNTTLTSITKSGAGLLTLGGNNTFTGGVVINDGTLVLGNAGALNSTAGSQNAVTFGASTTGTLALAGNSLVVANLSTNTTPGTTFVQNANGSSVANVTLTVGNSTNASGTFAGIIRDGTGGGTLALTKAGTGTLTLSGANSYSGGTTLTTNSGILAISNATSLGGGSVTVTGTSRINATGGITYANAIAVNAALTMQNPNTATSTATFSGVLSGSGTISLPNSNGGNAVQGIIAFTNPNNTFTGSVVLSGSGAGDEHFQFNSIGDGGNFTFAKNGNRQLITHTGSSNITFATRTINISSTMTNMTTRQGMDGGGGNPVSSFFSSGTGALTFNANMGMTSLATDGAFYFNGTNSGDNTFAGTIGEPTSAGRLWIGKLGTGTWLLTADNTYEGGTIIAGGILSVAKIADAATAQPLGKGPLIQFGVGNNGASGSLIFTGSTNSTTDKQVVIGAMNQANSSAAGSILNNGSGTLTFSNAAFNPTITGNVVAGITTIAVTVARTLTIGGTNTGANAISGIIQNNSATGSVALTKANAGTWVLSGSNSYTGLTTISGGVLRITNNTALGTTAGGVTVASGSGLEIDGTSGAVTVGAEAISIAGGGVTLPTPDLGAIRNIAGNNTYGGTVTLTAQSRINSDSGTLLLNNATAVTGAARNLVVGGAGNVTISGAITTTTGFLFMDGAGTLTLSGANTYTGLTGVNGGTLKLGANNVIPNASNVNIGTATLDGDTRTDTAGTLDVAGAATINLGSGAALAFADSKLVDWTGGTLNITGTLGATSLRFGTDNTGLSPAQLAVISVNGSGLGTYILDASGYLVAGSGDATPPTLTSITDNVSGGPVNIGATVTYTVTFSEDMDDTTVNAADFANNGTAGVTVGTVTEGSPGVFSVPVTTTSPGTLVLRINALAVLEDVAGNDLDTDPALLDDTTITVRNAYQTWALTNAISSAPGQDKDGDGVNNAIEFLLGGDVSTNDLSKLPEVTTTATEMIITFERKRSSTDGITGCEVEVGTTLTGWPTSYTVGATTGSSDAGVVVTENSPVGFDTITVTVPKGSDPKKFGRLNVSVTE